MIKSIKLTDFRNYREFGAEFTPGRNVILGRNGQGKSNLLEAVYMMASGRSFRSVRDRDMIAFGKDSASIMGTIETNQREVTHEIRLSQTGRRVNMRSGVKLARNSDFSETMTAVIFAPDDLDIVRLGAERRRRLLDECISQLRPKYAEALTRHTKLHAHKTRILKDWRENPSLLDALPEFCEELIETDSQLIFYRAAFVLMLAPRAGDIHNKCSDGAENLSLSYKTVAGADPQNPDRAEIRNALQIRQRELAEAEKASGSCLVGARRDDIEIYINGIEARKFGSQGQTRTAALAVKLAERGIMKDETDNTPVLLLDDVLSELDDIRRGFILGAIDDGQTFITACDDIGVLAGPGNSYYHIENGALKT